MDVNKKRNASLVVVLLSLSLFLLFSLSVIVHREKGFTPLAVSKLPPFSFSDTFPLSGTGNEIVIARTGDDENSSAPPTLVAAQEALEKKYPASFLSASNTNTTSKKLVGAETPENTESLGEIFEGWSATGPLDAYAKYSISSFTREKDGTGSQMITAEQIGVGISRNFKELDPTKTYQAEAWVYVEKGGAQMGINAQTTPTKTTAEWVNLISQPFTKVSDINLYLTTSAENSVFFVDGVRVTELEGPESLPVIHMSASQPTVKWGDNVFLTWTITGATSCTTRHSHPDQQPRWMAQSIENTNEGYYDTISLWGDGIYTYSIDCTNANGQTSASVDVTLQSYQFGEFSCSATHDPADPCSVENLQAYWPDATDAYRASIICHRESGGNARMQYASNDEYSFGLFQINSRVWYQGCLDGPEPPGDVDHGDPFHFYNCEQGGGGGGGMNINNLNNLKEEDRNRTTAKRLFDISLNSQGRGHEWDYWTTAEWCNIYQQNPSNNPPITLSGSLNTCNGASLANTTTNDLKGVIGITEYDTDSNEILNSWEIVQGYHQGSFSGTIQPSRDPNTRLQINFSLVEMRRRSDGSLYEQDFGVGSLTPYPENISINYNSNQICFDNSCQPLNNIDVNFDWCPPNTTIRGNITLCNGYPPSTFGNASLTIRGNYHSAYSWQYQSVAIQPRNQDPYNLSFYFQPGLSYTAEIGLFDQDWNYIDQTQFITVAMPNSHTICLENQCRDINSANFDLPYCGICQAPPEGGHINNADSPDTCLLTPTASPTNTPVPTNTPTTPPSCIPNGQCRTSSGTCCSGYQTYAAECTSSSGYAYRCAPVPTNTPIPPTPTVPPACTPNGQCRTSSGTCCSGYQTYAAECTSSSGYAYRCAPVPTNTPVPVCANLFPGYTPRPFCSSNVSCEGLSTHILYPPNNRYGCNQGSIEPYCCVPRGALSGTPTRTPTPRPPTATPRPNTPTSIPPTATPIPIPTTNCERTYAPYSSCTGQNQCGSFGVHWRWNGGSNYCAPADDGTPQGCCYCTDDQGNVIQDVCDWRCDPGRPECQAPTTVPTNTPVPATNTPTRTPTPVCNRIAITDFNAAPTMTQLVAPAIASQNYLSFTYRKISGNVSPQALQLSAVYNTTQNSGLMSSFMNLVSGSNYGYQVTNAWYMHNVNTTINKYQLNVVWPAGTFVCADSPNIVYSNTVNIPLYNPHGWARVEAANITPTPYPSSCRLLGWTRDQDADIRANPPLGVPLAVHVYKNGRYGAGGQFLTSTTANILRSGIGFGAGFENHGYDINFYTALTPTQLAELTGTSIIPLYVYAINATGTAGGNTLISSTDSNGVSTVNIRCNPNGPTLTPTRTPTRTPTATRTPTPTLIPVSCINPTTVPATVLTPGQSITYQNAQYTIGWSPIVKYQRLPAGVLTPTPTLGWQTCPSITPGANVPCRYIPIVTPGNNFVNVVNLQKTISATPYICGWNNTWSPQRPLGYGTCTNNCERVVRVNP